VAWVPNMRPPEGSGDSTGDEIIVVAWVPNMRPPEGSGDSTGFLPALGLQLSTSRNPNF